MRIRRRNPNSGSSRHENLVVGSKIKELVAKEGLRSSGDLTDALSKYLAEKIRRAIERAKANGRQTLRPEDL